MFSPAYIQYGEIVDEKKYQQELKKFFQKIKLKEKKGILVLSHELVFFKEVQAPYKSEVDEIGKFLKDVPLIRDNLTVISPHNARKLQLLATNGRLFGVIVEAFKDRSIDISSVVPVSVLNVGQVREFTAEDVKNILKKKEIIEKYNFLQGRQNLEIDKVIQGDDSQGFGEEKESMQKQYIFLAFALIFLAGTIGYFLLWSEIIPNPWFKKPIVSREMPTVKVVVSITPKPSPAKEKQLMDKSSVAIQILNGSGIEGQAEEINLLLQNAGYNNIITGNAESLESTTKITYKSQVSEEILNNIMEEVEKILPDISAPEASQSAEFDVVIVTGIR